MAKVVIAGSTVTVKSSVKLEDLRKVYRFKPDALTLYGGEEGKEPIFCIRPGTESLTGSINKYGVEFACKPADDGSAIVALIPSCPESVTLKEFVVDNYGVILANLKELENSVPAIIQQIDEEREEISGNITVAV